MTDRYKNSIGQGINIKKDVSLRRLHTFQFDVRAAYAVEVANCSELACALKWYRRKRVSSLVLLGGGSNTIFLEHFDGMIVQPKFLGVKVTEDENAWYVHAGAGESWHDLVMQLVNRGIGGLENLAFIPGTAGGAPIQNISAYGVSFQEYCQYVDIFHCETSQVIRLPNPSCKFGYRTSRFKCGQGNQTEIVVAIGLQLPKAWSPQLTYAKLATTIVTSDSPRQVARQIGMIRSQKLPSTSQVPNAGSFFKNPEISLDQVTTLRRYKQDVPIYQREGAQVVPAAWLIQEAGLKSLRVGGAGSWPRHALVLTALPSSTPIELLQLAQQIQRGVFEKFGILLEPEVQLVTRAGLCSFNVACTHLLRSRKSAQIGTSFSG